MQVELILLVIIFVGRRGVTELDDKSIYNTPLWNYGKIFINVTLNTNVESSSVFQIKALIEIIFAKEFQRTDNRRNNHQPTPLLH